MKSNLKMMVQVASFVGGLQVASSAGFFCSTLVQLFYPCGIVLQISGSAIVKHKLCYLQLEQHFIVV